MVFLFSLNFDSRKLLPVSRKLDGLIKACNEGGRSRSSAFSNLGNEDDRGRETERFCWEYIYARHSSHQCRHEYRRQTFLDRCRSWRYLRLHFLHLFFRHLFPAVQSFGRNWRKYTSKKIFTKLIWYFQIKFNQVPFPAVTMCNLNPIRNSKLHTMPGLKELAGVCGVQQNKIEKMKEPAEFCSVSIFYSCFDSIDISIILGLQSQIWQVVSNEAAEY